ncbi:alpha/beta fold hydrolase [Arenibacter sp. GZD96]|uniref:alpha/beta fold hydrolase n=1 Tax=Aurantibrevibacter litoralis TaxID=3106030 RepID=UPI002B003899|nr:alpha/beta fold hydrolase [Arenibacter sp. GZD-96]MEA1784710.1 alpha/beta fold hydrolase [Arenibacter sp. GZD-96]
MKIVHASVLGNGRPLLILHGFLGMADNWKTLGNQYAKEGFEVHLIDQRNHGKSFKSEEFTYEWLAKDVHNYMVHKGLNKAMVLGHSMGGKTAMQFACTFPDFTEKLMVADMAPKYYPPHHKVILDALNQLDLDTLTSRNEADAQLGNYITDWGTRQFLLKNLYWVSKEKLGFRFNLKVLATKMEEIGEGISGTAVYEGPTLFLVGERSEYVTQTDYPEIKRHFPNATVQSIEKAGHWLHAENPKQFFEKSLSFMKS